MFKLSSSPLGKSSISRKGFFGAKFNLFVIFLWSLTLSMWVIIRFTGTTTDEINYIYSLLLGIFPLVAGFKGLEAAQKWGGFASVLGRAIGALAIGVMFWGLGELVWSYYNLILEVPAPYPSLADAVWILGYLFWILSALSLIKVSGVRLVLKKRPHLWGVAALVILAGMAISYYLLIVVARQNHILSDPHSATKVFLDIYYPFGDFAAFTLVAIIGSVSLSYIGGKLRTPIVLTMLGLATMYVADTVFAYTTTKGTFYNGDVGDLLLLIGMSFLSLSLLKYSSNVPGLGFKSRKE
jgi:hypothetical protein